MLTEWRNSRQTPWLADTLVHPSTSSVGVDVGIARFATLSEGTDFEPCNFEQHQGRIARYQRAMRRKQKFNSNCKTAKAKVVKIHQKIGNIRRDTLHKTTISKNHAMVCIEDLQVGNMSRSAAGTVGQLGRKVKAKAGLNRSTLDQGWYEFRRQLDTSRHGQEAGCWQSRHRIPAGDVQAASMCRQRIIGHRPIKGGGHARLAVQRWCSKAPRRSRNSSERLCVSLLVRRAVGISGV